MVMGISVSTQIIMISSQTLTWLILFEATLEKPQLPPALFH